jgi:hypothetical protein
MATTEIKGSRETTETGKIKTAVMLEVSDSAAGSKAIGDFYLSETTPTGRVMVHQKIQPEFLPGIFLVVSQFQGVVSHS